MTYVLAAVIVTLLAVHAWERRQFTDAIARLQATPSADTAALISLVENLCQRVQAPAQAVVDHTLKTVTPDPEQPGVPPEDDHAFWTSQGLTKEQLAEVADRIELAG